MASLGLVARLEHGQIHAAGHGDDRAFGAIGQHLATQRLAGGNDDGGFAHSAAQRGHEAGDARLAEPLEIVVKIGSVRRVQLARQPACQRHVRDVGSSDEEVGPEGAQLPQQVPGVSGQPGQPRLAHGERLPGQGARHGVVRPLAGAVSGVVIEAVAVHRMAQPGELMGDFVQARVAVEHHVFAHVAAFAKKGNAHL